MHLTFRFTFYQNNIDMRINTKNLLLGARVFLTIALDVVISGISQPVRFLIEARARINEGNKTNDLSAQDIGDTIWASFKKITPFTEEFHMTVKQVNRKYIKIEAMKQYFVFSKVSSANSRPDEIYEVVHLESKSEAERRAKLQRLSTGYFFFVLSL